MTLLEWLFGGLTKNAEPDNRKPYHMEGHSGHSQGGSGKAPSVSSASSSGGDSTSPFVTPGGFGGASSSAPVIRQEKRHIYQQERVICGMGSGGPEDVNTYAMVDKLRDADPDFGRVVLKPAVATEGSFRQDEGVGVLVSPDTIADVMDRSYTRDPKTMDLVLKDDVPVAAPFTEDEIKAAKKKGKR